jgi:hypothetical protein
MSKLLGTLTAAAVASATMFVAANASAKLATPSGATSGAHCPAEMAYVNGSCVDKWEGSLVEVNADGSTTPWSPYKSPVGVTVKAVSQPNVVPQAHISMVQAKAACEEAGKRLCHVDEWKSACKGPEHTKYPYGDEHKANMCVDTNRTAPLGKLFSSKEMFGKNAMNDERLNQMDNTVEKTGEAAACTNDYGVHDMVGNVHEWLDDGAFHGGYYLDTKINREGCDYATTAHNAIYYDYSTGFRCCADADSVPVEEVAPTSAPKKELPKETPENAYIFDHLARVVQGLGGASGTASLGGFVGLAPAIVEDPKTSAIVRARRAKG